MAGSIKFGTGGWRALIGEDFIADNIRKVAQAAAIMIREDGQQHLPVPIGWDRRFLSDTAAQWLAEVLCANGIPVLMMHRSAPTPLIMHTVKVGKLHCGLQVTASHNPSGYNGIKLIVKQGRDAPEETTQRLEGIIEALREKEIRRMPLSEAEAAGLMSYLHNPFDAFIDDIISRLDMEAIHRRGLRIAFDSMHGSGTFPLMVILCTARCTLDIIHQNKDAYFGSAMPAPSERTLTELAYTVKNGAYDLGVAFDGDGDRLGIIDENGRYVHANEILCMLYWYLHEIKGWKGAVVRNLATTHMLDAMARDFGEICCEVPVGFKHISAKMDETDALIGGESSGGLTVRGHIHGKDSVYAACLFVEMLSVTGLTTGQILSRFHEKYGRHIFIEEVLRFTDAEKQMLTEALLHQRQIPDFDQVERISWLDGCKICFSDGSFIVCRFSGTEPVLRLMAEARSETQAKSRILIFRNFIDLVLSGK